MRIIKPGREPKKEIFIPKAVVSVEPILKDSYLQYKIVVDCKK